VVAEDPASPFGRAGDHSCPAEASSDLAGRALGLRGVAGRAFQSRDRRGHIRATIERIAADNTGHRRAVEANDRPVD
jgi:hypothetical protein